MVEVDFLFLPNIGVAVIFSQASSITGNKSILSSPVCGFCGYFTNFGNMADMSCGKIAQGVTLKLKI
jgi:hypothetical protein